MCKKIIFEDCFVQKDEVILNLDINEIIDLANNPGFEKDLNADNVVELLNSHEELTVENLIEM